MEYILYPFALIVYTVSFFMIGFYVGQGKERTHLKRTGNRVSDRTGK